MEGLVREDFWKGRRVLITGATGLLGSWLSRRLAGLKAEIIIILRDEVPDSYLFLSGIHKKVITVRGGMEDFFLILRTLNEYEIEYCFHLASQALVPVANNQPLSTFESNLRGTYHLFESARIYGKIKGIVSVSSDKVYGEQERLPIEEGYPLKGRFPYEVSKICAEYIARTYQETYSIPVLIPRFSNIYGGGDLNWNRLIPGVIRDIYEGRDPRIRSSGQPVRDFIFIDDALQALLILMENIERGDIQGEVFNFGTGIPIKVVDVANLILQLTGATHLKADILMKGGIKGEIERQYLSIEKAGKFFNFKPRSTLKEGLIETIKWYNDFFKNRGRI